MQSSYQSQTSSDLPFLHNRTQNPPKCCFWTKKIIMFEGIYVIAPVRDKGYRLILSEITHLIKGTNPFLIGIIASFMEKLVCCHLHNL